MDLDTPFHKYLTGGAVSLLAKGVGIVSGFGSLWFLTTLLQQDGFGGYTTGVTVAALIALLARLGFKNTIIQLIAEGESADRETDRYWGAVAFWTGCTSIVLGLLVWFGAPFVLNVLGEGSDLIFWIKFGAGLIPAMTAQAIQGVRLRGYERIPQALLFEQILPSSLRVIGLSVVYLLSPTVESVIAAIYAAQYLPSIGLFVYDRQWNLLNATGIDRSQLKLVGHFFVNSVASRFLTDTDIILLSTLAGLAATGSYQVAWKLSMVSRYTDDALTNVITPRYSKFVSNSEYGKLRSELNMVREVSLVGGGFVVLVVLLLGEPLLGLFGDYQDQYATLVLLSIGGGLLNPGIGPVGQILLMAKEGRLIMLNSLVTLCLNIVGNAILIPEYGALGAAISTVLTLYLLNGVFSIVLVRHSLAINVFELRIALSILAPTALTLGTLFLGVPVWIPLVVLLAMSLYYLRRSGHLFSAAVGDIRP